jgi:hypothetical protein
MPVHVLEAMLPALWSDRDAMLMHERKKGKERGV